MKLLITGAGGFLGRYVVAEAIRAGHDVSALLRPASGVPDATWLAHPRLHLARADLRRRIGLAPILEGIEAVIHVAAAKTGDIYAQFAGTVVATENLLAAMDQAHIGRLVEVSSLSVYDYRANRFFSTLDENSPLERTPFARDGYTQAKLVQERLVRAFATDRGWRYAIVRPGVIFGPDNLLPARAGMQLNERTILRLGGFAPLPLVYVENCAQAVVLAVEKTDGAGPVFNLIDDAQPTQRQYVRMLQRRMSPRPRVMPIPWPMLQSAAIGAELCNKMLFSGRAKIPGLLVPARLAARINPYRYDNRKSKETLGWRPRYPLTEALDRSIAGIAASVPMELARKAAA